LDQLGAVLASSSTWLKTSAGIDVGKKLRALRREAASSEKAAGSRGIGVGMGGMGVWAVWVA
jgi:hypothetical protein